MLDDSDGDLFFVTQPINVSNGFDIVVPAVEDSFGVDVLVQDFVQSGSNPVLDLSPKIRGCK